MLATVKLTTKLEIGNYLDSIIFPDKHRKGDIVYYTMPVSVVSSDRGWMWKEAMEDKSLFAIKQGENFLLVHEQNKEAFILLCKQEDENSTVHNFIS